MDKTLQAYIDKFHRGRSGSCPRPGPGPPGPAGCRRRRRRNGFWWSCPGTGRCPGRLKGKKVAMTWAYSPSYGKPLSVPQGVIGLMTRFGMDVVLAHPEGVVFISSSVQHQSLCWAFWASSSFSRALMPSLSPCRTVERGPGRPALQTPWGRPP